MEDIEQKLKRDIDRTTWRELRPHVVHERVFCVADPPGLLAVAVAVARDNSEQVQRWLQEGSVVRPTVEQLGRWEREMDKPFDCAVVSPYVLVAEVGAEG